jgi:hypothetical protein
MQDTAAVTPLGYREVSVVVGETLNVEDLNSTGDSALGVETRNLVPDART